MAKVSIRALTYAAACHLATVEGNIQMPMTHPFPQASWHH